MNNNDRVFILKEHVDKVQLLFSGGMTGLTAIVGGWDTAFSVFFYCVLLDIVTGVINGIKDKNFSSKRMREGFVTKVGYIVVIALATQIDRIMPDGLPVMRTLVLYFYVAVEGSSILENLAQIGVPIPQIVLDRLAILKGKGDSKDDDNAK